MTEPTHYYIEYLGCPKEWAPVAWIEFLKTLDKKLVKASGLENILSVIQQSYEKNNSPLEKEDLVLIEDTFNSAYTFRLYYWEVLQIKEAYLCTLTTKN